MDVDEGEEVRRCKMCVNIPRPTRTDFASQAAPTGIQSAVTATGQRLLPCTPFASCLLGTVTKCRS